MNLHAIISDIRGLLRYISYYKFNVYFLLQIRRIFPITNSTFHAIDRMIRLYQSLAMVGRSLICLNNCVLTYKHPICSLNWSIFNAMMLKIWQYYL